MGSRKYGILIQKCSGKGCVKNHMCLHYEASKSPRKTRGSWIDVDVCIGKDIGDKQNVKEEYDKLLLKEEK